MTQYAEPDPFADLSVPALSFAEVPVGTKYRLRIDGPAKKLQGRDFDTNKPLFWDEEKTQPVMCAVVNATVLSGPKDVGEDRSIWAQIPSAMFRAIGTAQKEFGRRMDKGDEIEVWQHGSEPNKDKKKAPMKLYTAKLFEGSSADPFSSSAQNDEPPPF